MFFDAWWFRYIRRGKPDAGFALFESESLKWPGFVEFDDVNGKVLTYSAQDRYIFVSIFAIDWVISYVWDYLFSNLLLLYYLYVSSYVVFMLYISIYKVFDLKNYTMLYSISDKNVQEIKIR